MSDGKGRPLDTEERILWSRVARTARPLPGRAFPDDDPPRADPGFAEVMAERPSLVEDPSPASRGSAPPTPRRIDAPLRRKIARGHLPIDGKLDLHGLTQAEAYGLLLSFLHRAHAQGRRNLLVVTGKGSSMGSEGVLRRAVPAWLATPPFRGLVHSHDPADRRHGGQGALYVRLRGRTGESP